MTDTSLPPEGPATGARDAGALRFQELSRHRLADGVADQLREKILRADIAPGTKLVQTEVARQLGVSRTPLREAFHILIKEGLLVPGKGVGTAEVVALTHQDAEDLYGVREVLDGLAARLAAKRQTEDSLLSLRQSLDQLLDAADPFESRKFAIAHTNFHVEIVMLSGNARLLQLVPIVRMSADMLFGRYPASPARMLVSAHEHEAIYDAIAGKNASKAERLARKHISAAAKHWLA
jgi:GntR family transcriptional regulator of vanillate catabolism